MSKLYRIERPSSRPTKGFEKKYLPELNQERKDEFRDKIWDWSERQIKTTMGFINAVTFSIAEDAKAVYIENGKRAIVPRRIRRLCKYGCWQLYTTIKGITQYISEWWDEVVRWNDAIGDGDRRTVRKVRDTLADMGLLTFKKLEPHQRSWQTFSDIDFGGLLLLYEVLEEALLDDHFCDFDWDLPEHKGALVRAFYNTCEEMLGVFRRSGDSSKEKIADKKEAAKPKQVLPFVCKYKIDGEEFDANLYNRQGVSFRDVVFAEKARLEKLRKSDSHFAKKDWADSQIAKKDWADPQFAKKDWFESLYYQPEADLLY